MTGHLEQEIQLKKMRDLEDSIRDSSFWRKRKVRHTLDSRNDVDETLDELGVDPNSDVQRDVAYRAAAPHPLLKWAERAMYATLCLGLSGAIGFMEYRTYESPEEIEQRVADNIAMVRLVTAADTNCDSRMSATEFEALYERRTGQRFPQSMGYQPVVLTVSSTKQDDTITYLRMEESPYMSRPHNYLYMSRDTALRLAEDAPDHCHITVPDFL